MPGRVNGFTLAYAATGAVVLWSGIKGETISDTFRGLLKGKAPNQNTEPITGSADTGPGTTITSANAANFINVAGASNASQDQWAKDLLAALGAPATQANVNSLIDWMAHEEPALDWSHWNNPMNTTQPESGSRPMNSAGVQEYPDLQVGLQATAQTLSNGLYGDILMQLRAGKGLRSGASRGLLTWSGGAYSSV